MTETEEEVVFLKAIIDAIDSMINRQVLDLYGEDPESSILFNTSTDQRYFNILLTDFLSRTDRRAAVRQTSYLAALRAISASPAFGNGGSVGLLQQATGRFTEWLEEEIEADTWMPSIDRQVLFKLTRITFLKMCGDLSKHNFLRAVGVAEDLQQLLAACGVDVTIEEALLAFDDFYQRFHDDILNYHGSTLAEHLNNIRWGIYEYLQPEYHRSIVWISRDPPNYRYTYPSDVQSSFAQACYWNLMNLARRKPYLRKFTVTKWLKLRY